MGFKEAICIAGHTWIQSCANVIRHSTLTLSYHSRFGGEESGRGQVSVKQRLETGRNRMHLQYKNRRNLKAITLHQAQCDKDRDPVCGHCTETPNATEPGL
jgi:hypothetical protein